MNKYLMILVLAFTSLAFSRDMRIEKKVLNSFYVASEQPILLKTVSGMDVEVVAWDKDSLKFDLYLDVDCSDKDYEKYYIEKFEIRERGSDDILRIEIHETSREADSFWEGLFKFQFHYSFEKEISGTIYVPRKSDFKADFKYGKVNLNNLEGSLAVEGRSNELTLKKCSNIRAIENQYGNIKMYDCAGNPFLESRSANLNVENFDGPLDIQSDYSNIKLSKISSNIKIGSRSGSVDIIDARGNIKIKAPYSNIEINTCEKDVDIVGRSANIRVNNIHGLSIDAQYSNLYIDECKAEGKIISLLTRSGIIEISNSQGTINIDDQYSNMEFEKITGNVDILSRSGIIRASKMKGNWKSKTQYSTIEIYDIEADIVDITNRSNQVEINFITNPDDVSIKNDYGGVELMFPSDYGAVYKLYSTYASILSDFPVDIKEQSSSMNAFGQIGKGNGSLYIETRSGDIVLKQKP